MTDIIDPAAGQGNTDPGSGEGTVLTETEPKVEGSWLDALPDDLKGNEALKGYKDAGEAAKALVELQGKLPVVPESADAYEITIPEGQQYSEALINSAKQWALEAGMSQEQLGKFTERYLAHEAQVFQEIQKQEQEALGALEKEWGSSFEANVERAKRAISRFGDAEFKQFLDSSRLGNNPAMVKMFLKVAEAMSEDTLSGDGNKPKERPTTRTGEGMLNFPSMVKK